MDYNTKTFTGFYDDNDKPIHCGNILEHETGMKIIVIELSNKQYGGKLINPNTSKENSVIYHLNNGIGFVIISKTINELDL